MKYILINLAALATTAFSQSSTTESSSSSTTTAFPNLAQFSSIRNSLISEGIIPSTATGPPFPGGTFGPGFGPYAPGGPGGPRGPGGPGGHHFGPGGYGPWGSGSWGPASCWSTNTDWRSGPWTSWWAHTGCPGSDWPGWTEGPWSTAAPWTSWSQCTASTKSTVLVTTTSSGVVSTITQFNVQVAEAQGTPESGAGATASSVAAQSTNAAVQRGVGGVGVAVGALVAGLAAL